MCKMSLIGFGRKWLLLNRVLSQHLPGGTKENHKDLGQDRWCLGQGVNLAHPEYKFEVLSVNQPAQFQLVSLEQVLFTVWFVTMLKNL